MSEILSDYVASLSADGEPPGMASYEEVLEELRTLLVRELRRRGLWRAPPAFRGYEGARWGDGALDDLVIDAYTFTFVDRLRGLRNQQRLKGNIRPMVVRNVRNFLNEILRKTDPLGYRIFGRLREAVEILIKRGEVLVHEKKDRVLSNSTKLSFRPGMAPLTSRADLEEPVRRWNDDLLPDLLTAEGLSVPAVVERLAEKVTTLKDDGVAAFRFGDLIAALKDDASKRWDGVWEQSLGELGTEVDDSGVLSTVRVDQPEDTDWPRRLLLIQECVASSIDAERPPKLRRDLTSLWFLIRSTRLRTGEVGPIPSYAELGRQLKLTRDRVRQLFERLWPVIQACLHTAGQVPRASVAIPTIRIRDQGDAPRAAEPSRESTLALGFGAQVHQKGTSRVAHDSHDTGRHGSGPSDVSSRFTLLRERKRK